MTPSKPNVNKQAPTIPPTFRKTKPPRAMRIPAVIELLKISTNDFIFNKVLLSYEETKLNLIAKEYNKNGIDALNTKNVMKLLNCSDITALRYIRKFCKEYNIDCPIKTKTNQTFNKDEVLQQIKNEYDKYGVEFLTTKNVKKLLNCSGLTARKYSRLFCKAYNIARLEKNKKSASQNLEILE